MSKILLKVPIYRQKPKSVDCGIVCLQMIYDFFGRKISFAKLKKDLPTTKIGTYLPQLGSHFQKHEFQTEIITLNPKLFHREDAENRQIDLVTHFNNLKKLTENDNDKMVLDFFIEYLHQGGLITSQIPDAKIIISNLSKKNLLLAVLNTTPLHQHNKEVHWKDSFHIVVITGIDNKNVYLNDPHWSKNGGKKKHPLINFFFSLYSSSLTDPDNGSLLIISR